MMRIMRTRVHAVLLPSDAEEFTDELRRLLAEMGPLTNSALTAECSPPLDIYETDDTLEIAVDLPGVESSGIRIVAKGNAVLIAGEKTPRRGRGDASFHLVERGYGRFARVARLASPCNTAAARAMFRAGELRISIPKIQDRRGHRIPISIAGEPPIA